MKSSCQVSNVQMNLLKLFADIDNMIHWEEIEDPQGLKDELRWCKVDAAYKAPEEKELPYYHLDKALYKHIG